MYDLLRKLEADPTALEVLGTGEQVRDYCYVTDTARCFLAVAEHGKRTDGGVYNDAGGRPISIKELTVSLLEARELRDVDVSFTGQSWKGDINVLIANISKARQDLGFEPTVSLEEGIGLLADWLRSAA